MTSRPATFREVFAVKEFRALFFAQLMSGIGDQIAKVALAILVYRRSGSALLAALAYAVTYLPWLVGGPILTPLADRFPRRAVMLTCDLARAVIVALMALPGLRLPVLFALLLTAGVFTPPFDAARAASIPEALPGDLYVVGSAAMGVLLQLMQGIGFLIGGAVVAALRPRGALLLDAGTFIFSALLIVGWVERRPSATGGGRPRFWRDMLDGARVVHGSRVLRSTMLVAWVGSAFAVVPEGLAVTYAAALHRGPVATGVLTAAAPFGCVVGVLVVVRFVAPDRRLRLVIPLALATFVPLILTAFHPAIAGAAALWALSGVGMAFSVPANAAFVATVPNAVRGRAFGLAQAGLQVVQGLALAGAGALALRYTPHAVIAMSGLLGLAGIGLLAVRWPYAEMRALGAPVPVPEPRAEQEPAEAPAAVATLVEQVEEQLEEATPQAEPSVLLWTQPYVLEPEPEPRRVVLRLLDLD